MKTIASFAVQALLCVVTAGMFINVGDACADTIITDDGTGKTRPERYLVGYDFKVGSIGQTVTALGIWDDSATDTPNGPPALVASPDGLVKAHEVGLWSITGTLLASVNIPAGTSATLIGEFRYVDLVSPVVLQANTTYTLGAEYYGGLGAAGAGMNGPDLWHDTGEVPVGSPPTFPLAVYSSSGAFNSFEGRAGNSGTFVRPNFPGGDGNAYIGPNALVTPVPEPASIGLLLLGCCSLVAPRLISKKGKMRVSTFVLSLAVLAILAGGSASQAANIPIANGDFQAATAGVSGPGPSGTIGANNDIPSWIATDSGSYQAIYDPGFFRSPGGFNDNNQWLYQSGGTNSAIQNVTTLANNTLYTLNVTVGQDNDDVSYTFPSVGNGVTTGSAFSRLLVDTSLAQDGSSLVAMPGVLSSNAMAPGGVGAIVHWTISWTTGASESLAGDHVYVQLAANGGFDNSGLYPEVFWDNVSLTATSVPEPTSVCMLVIGCCGLAIARRLRKRAARA